MLEANKPRSIITCPYFQRGNNGECQMLRGGLYIPLSAHIEIFCTTIKYTSCPQFMRGKALIQESIRRSVEISDSRRRFPRIRNRFPTTISTCDEKGRPVQVIDREAITLDLSLGGIKISSYSEIPTNKILHFSFREDFNQVPITGIGEVRWCRHAEGPRPFQAGLSFLDNTPPEVSERLGLQGKGTVTN